MGKSSSSRTPRTRLKHIFCLEGDWWGNLKRPSTVRPIFDLVSQMHPGLDYVYRCLATRPEFDHYLGTWAQRQFRDYPVLYLAFHGSERTLHVGNRRRGGADVDLDEIAELLRGRCNRRIIHFATCSTLGCDRRHLKRFLQITDAVAVCGYRDDVGWIDSAAFEVFLLTGIQQYAVTVGGMRAVSRRISEVAGQLARSLGFRLEIRH